MSGFPLPIPSLGARASAPNRPARVRNMACGCLVRVCSTRNLALCPPFLSVPFALCSKMFFDMFDPLPTGSNQICIYVLRFFVTLQGLSKCIIP
jgi:hypothetical protein